MNYPQIANIQCTCPKCGASILFLSKNISMMDNRHGPIICQVCGNSIPVDTAKLSSAIGAYSHAVSALESLEHDGCIRFLT